MTKNKKKFDRTKTSIKGEKAEQVSIVPPYFNYIFIVILLADKRRFRIVLAEVFLNFFVGNPANGPTSAPGSCIGPGIIDGHFIP